MTLRFHLYLSAPSERKGIEVIIQDYEVFYMEDRHLTQREKIVTCLLMAGIRQKQIADWLSISVKSVSAHKRKVMKKIGVKNNAEFVEWFISGKKRKYH